VALRDHVIEPELVEKARLISIRSPHHSRILPISFDQESSFATPLNPFFDSIGQKRKSKRALPSSALTNVDVGSSCPVPAGEALTSAWAPEEAGC